MLVTTCTHCRARFRVTPQQLNVKQGRVRCGRCRNVFNGFEALERFPDDDTGTRILAERDAQRHEPPEPIRTLPADELPGTDASPPAGPMRPVEEPGTPSKPLPPYRPELRRTPLDESEAPPARSISRAWRLGAFLLALLLAGELLFAFRTSVAVHYPALRPWLESACAAIRCRVAWPHQESLLKLEDSELLEAPGKPHEIQLGARIRNLASVPQEFPYLELTLTDLGGQVAVRRVLAPRDYLGRVPAPAEALAAGGEVAVQLRLETPRTKATGYELLLFYP